MLARKRSIAAMISSVERGAVLLAPVAVVGRAVVVVVLVVVVRLAPKVELNELNGRLAGRLVAVVLVVVVVRGV